jgi:hypothetical protein
LRSIAELNGEIITTNPRALPSSSANARIPQKFSIDGESAVDNVTIIRVVAGIVALCVLAIGIAYIAFLSGVLRKCAPSSRTMQPGMVWLLLLPLFNLVWNFLVVIALADSLGNEFRLRNLQTDDPKPGKSIGIAMAVCGACGIVPFLNILALPVQFVLWIVYWVKIAGYSRQLDYPLIPAATAANPQVT